MRVQKYNHISDAELLENFYKDLDNKWLGILLPRYTLLLLGVCMKYLKNEEDSRDCVQQIFLKVINELHKYKVEYFKSWIYMIAKNHCLMRLRGNKNYHVELSDQVIPHDEISVDKSDLIEKDRLLQKMQEALKQTSPRRGSASAAGNAAAVAAHARRRATHSDAASPVRRPGRTRARSYAPRPVPRPVAHACAGTSAVRRSHTAVDSRAATPAPRRAPRVGAGAVRAAGCGSPAGTPR